MTPTDDVLAGSRRSVVIRARSDGGEASVIIKAYAVGSGEGFVREAAALHLLDGRRSPRLLAASQAPPVVVMADLGGGGSLADALLGPDPDLAAAMVSGWAEALADVHAATWQRPDLVDAALAHYAGDVPVDLDQTPGMIDQAAGRLPEAAALLGLGDDSRVTGLLPAAAERLRALPARLDGPRALSPTDACPDNNLRIAGGSAEKPDVTLIDFEGASYRPVAWDLAYLRVPWATCWCAWTMPAEVGRRAEEAWWSRLATAGITPDRDALEADIERAELAWNLEMAALVMRKAVEGEEWHPDPRPGPRVRPMVQNHLRQVAGQRLDACLAEVAARMLERTVELWGDVPLQAAPAFR